MALRPGSSATARNAADTTDPVAASNPANAVAASDTPRSANAAHTTHTRAATDSAGFASG